MVKTIFFFYKKKKKKTANLNKNFIFQALPNKKYKKNLLYNNYYYF